MTNSNEFQKELAKLQIEATFCAVLCSTLIALGIAIIVYFISLPNLEVSEKMQWIGGGVIIGSIVLLYFMLKINKNKIDQADK
ncbi:MAG: hypothetical protein OER82_05945 [Nitrosopumilus sp.]|nr:hypothetical protein [Nitrosopumilus sp.]MDH3765335.1 hypothetical protein [Nitrosopumilus sp.]